MSTAEKQFVVVTTTGTDRPGIVADVSGWILQHKGNIEDSRMSQLGGEFATLILVSGDGELGQRLSASCDEVSRKFNLAIHTKPVSGARSSAGGALLRYDVRATSLDHPGIVHQVSQHLSGHGINIISASTRTSEAPFSAVPVFQFHLQVDIPGTVSLQKLRTELEELSSRENIDITLTASGE